MLQFGQLRTFYGSVWPDAVPYRILLNPQLDNGTDFTNKASASGNLVLLNCHPSTRDFVAGTAVVVHEMCHSLSVQQRLVLQRQLEGWYLHHASPNRRFAYNFMEEALATVAGQWVFAQQTGQLEAGEWYNDEYIDRYAKALYPVMAGYVERSQAIDSLFVSQAISIFDQTFPRAAANYVNLFRNVLYWSNADDFQATVRPFIDRFGSTFTQSATSILQSAAALRIAQNGEFLPMILVTREHKATLRYLSQNLPALRGQRLRPEKSFLLSATGPNSPIILVNVHDPAQLTAAAVLLAKQGHLDPAHPVKWLNE